jgi:RHS repeat-associated protein
MQTCNYDCPSHFVRCDYKSTGKERDTESGLDYFGARYYGSSMGRFMSPDPSGLMYADITNPQSFNLYSYAQNNPLINTDPSGMECVWDDGSFDSADDPDTGSGEKCGAQGGTWVDPEQFEHGLLTNGQYANYQRGDWSGSANSTLQQSWATPAATVSTTADNSITLQVPMDVWNWAALQTIPTHGLWTYGNWAGAGGMGAPINNTDAAAMMHDYCYSQGGYSPMSNYGAPNAGLQACNQALCDAANARINDEVTQANTPGTAEYNNIMAGGYHPTARQQENSADMDIRDYFTHVVRKGNACRSQ